MRSTSARPVTTCGTWPRPAWTTPPSARVLLLPEDHCERVGSLSDDDFPDGLTVFEGGAALATRWIIHGKDDVKGEGLHDGLHRLDAVRSVTTPQLVGFPFRAGRACS
jgi:hypothetical protein